MTENQRRPWPVWAISIYCGLCALGGIFGNVRILTSQASFQGPAAEFVHELNASDYLIAMAGVVLLIYAAMSLFQLKRIAVSLFLAIFLIGPLIEFYHWLTKPAYGAYFSQIGYLALISGLVVNGIILIYVNRLKQKGALIG